MFTNALYCFLKKKLFLQMIEILQYFFKDCVKNLMNKTDINLVNVNNIDLANRIHQNSCLSVLPESLTNYSL